MNGEVVPHFSELDYVFGLPILSNLDMVNYKNNNKRRDEHVYRQEEYDLSYEMMGFWANFAKYGYFN